MISGPALKIFHVPRLNWPNLESCFGVLRIDARKFARMWAALISQALIDKLQIIERYNCQDRNLQPTRVVCLEAESDSSHDGYLPAAQQGQPANAS